MTNKILSTRKPTAQPHLLVFVCGIVLATVAWATDSATLQEQRPNILLIVAEDMSSRVGAFGDPVAQTPAIDALAAESTRYPNTFAVSGVCAPSRAALITGMHSIALGTQHMRTQNRNPIPGLLNYDAVPPADVKAFPELLRRAGYATANLAKTDYQFGEPFTVWDLFEKNAFTQDLALWRQLPDDKPFFVMLNMLATHETQLAPPIPEGGEVTNPLLKTVAEMRAKMIRQVTDPASVAVPPYLPDTPKVRASIAQHYDNIHFMDQQVGRVLKELEADGLADNTIVIWTTDHGDAFPRAKRAVYDSGLQVPLVIRFPQGEGRGTVNRQMVSFVDVAPTILRLAGTEVPSYIQGQDFIQGSPRHYIHAAGDRMDEVPDRVRAVRDERFKYIRNYLSEEPYFRPLPFRDMFPIMQELWSGHKAKTLTPVQQFYFTSPRPREELYDTQSDPHEIHNLADNPKFAEDLARLRGEMDRWLAEVGDRSEVPEMEMIATMWPGLKQPVTAAPAATEEYSGKVRRVGLRSATPGASIGYRLLSDGAAPSGWLVYTQPLELAPEQRLEAKAIRYGYAESPVTILSSESAEGSPHSAQPRE